MRALAAAGGVVLLAACGHRPMVHQVEISSFRFQPDSLVVAPGDTVVWSNRDIVPHTATGAWDTGSIAKGGSGRWVAEGTGRREYVCAFHPTMHGVVIVR